MKGPSTTWHDAIRFYDKTMSSITAREAAEGAPLAAVTHTLDSDEWTVPHSRRTWPNCPYFAKQLTELAAWQLVTVGRVAQHDADCNDALVL